MAERGTSDKQLVEIIERRSAHHPQQITAEWMEHFLRGRLVLPAQPTVVDIRPYVNALINRGYHKYADNGKGIAASKYRKLWRPEVSIPVEARDRGFTHVLLVDQTIPMPALMELGRFEGESRLLEQTFPFLPDRYIALLRFETSRGLCSARYWWNMRVAHMKFDASDLTEREGLFIPVQHREQLLTRGFFLSVTIQNEPPQVISQFVGRDRPVLNTRDFDLPVDNIVPVERLIQVLPAL